MPAQTNDEREGALLKRFKTAGQGGRPASFGFMTKAEAEQAARARAMVVVARVAQGPNLAAEARALVEAGADGIEIVVRASASGLKDAISALEAPCGVYLAGGAEAPDMEGLDWIHVGLEAPARLLAVEKVTRIVGVPLALPPGRLGGLGALKAEILVVEDSANGVLTVETLLTLRAIEASTKQPLLVATSLGLVPDDMQVLHDHGVDGVLVTGGVEDVRAYIAAIDAIEKP